MVLTVNIPGTAIAALDINNNVTVSLLVNIMNGAMIYDSRTITIVVYRFTDQVLAYSVNLMVAEINRYKMLMQTQFQLQGALTTFTSQVSAQV